MEEQTSEKTWKELGWKTSMDLLQGECKEIDKNAFRKEPT